MNINPITSSNVEHNTYRNKHNNTKPVSFKGLNKGYEAEHLINSLKKMYGDCEQDTVFYKIIAFINEYKKTIFGNSGSNARFFNIPFIPNFGLRVKFPLTRTFESAESTHFETVSDIFPSHNFGQAVFSNKNGITFAKKVNGTPSSINNWYFYFCNQDLITRKQALEYKDKIEHIADFPEASFENFGRKIQIINQKNPRLLDFASPNNFMIDYKTQDITPIDLTDTGEISKKSLFHSMFHPLVDSELRECFISKMDTDEKNECLKFIDIIGEKVINAADTINKE